MNKNNNLRYTLRGITASRAVIRLFLNKISPRTSSRRRDGRLERVLFLEPRPAKVNEANKKNSLGYAKLNTHVFLLLLIRVPPDPGYMG